MRKSAGAAYLSLAIAFAAVSLCSCNKADSGITESAAEESVAEESVAATEKADEVNANAAGEAEASDVKSIATVIHKNANFDSAELDLDAEDFKAAGFSFGDSLDIVFSNGETLTDVPYFNGYYVKTGNPVVVAYPGNDYILIANANTDLWTPLKLENDMTVTITLNTAEKYLPTYEALGQAYSTDREDYASDEVFANFRTLKGGRLKSDYLYRGASPVDNSRHRAPYANALIEENSIACVIDLADSDEDMLEYFNEEDFSSDYAKELYENGKTAVLKMSASYSKDAYKQSVVKGLRKLLEIGGPAYIHCLEGKDRTGFVCMLIEALAGASYDEMRDDYMITYANYYNITSEETPERYNAVASLYFDTFMEYLSGESDAEKLRDLSYTDSARQYLISGGMTDAEIDELLSMITN